MGEEGLCMTPNKKIFIGRQIPIAHEEFFEQLDALKQYVYGLERDETVTREEISAAVEARLMALVPTFKRSE